jgi:predicted nucleic acid-binding protein
LIFYIETNFLMSIATGRDPQADTLLQNPPPSVQIAIPSICCLEALAALQQDKKSRKRFEQELIVQINETARNLTSPHAQALNLHLSQAREQNENLMDDTELGLFQAFRQIASKADLIALTTGILQESLDRVLIEDPTDNLILHCILGHAGLHPTEVKVFLSSNTKDFGTLEVREALGNAGIENYFSRSGDFLGWLQSQ